jgi:hypothetical protein
MAANAICKIQVSYGKDGLLLNVYADNAKELEELLTVVQDTASLLESVGISIDRPNPKPSNPNGGGAISYAKKALGATSVATDTSGDTVTDKNGTVWTYNRADAPDCINGKMVFAAGTSQKGKPYKGWFDPMKGPKPMRKPEGYVPVDPIFLK